MTTSATSPAPDCLPTLDGCRPSSSGAPPVRELVRRTQTRRASRTAAAPFISTLSGSSERFDQTGSRLRTLIASELEAMTGSRPRWSKSDTPAGHPWWRLDRPVIATVAPAAGFPASLAIYRSRWLPTPTKRNERMDRWSEAYERRKSPSLDALVDQFLKASEPSTTRSVHVAALLATTEWLMGYRPGWLASALLPMATPSFPTSPSSSPE